MVIRERRKRLRRPGLLIAFGIGLVLMPVANYLGAMLALAVPLHFYQVILRSFDPVQYGIMALSVIAGVGLLLIKKWGWWLALVLAGVITVYNLYILVEARALYNLGALLLTVFAVALFLYFTRKDISAPYMKMYPRGWRYQKRYPVQTNVRVDGRDMSTADLSPYGMYIFMDAGTFEPGQAVSVELPLDGKKFQLEAAIVRIDESGAGIAFRGVSPARRREIQKTLSGLV